MFNPKTSDNKVSKIENDFGKEIILISEFSEFDFKKTPLYDALIIDFADAEGAIALLRKIRSSNIESIYLIPVFVMSINKLDNHEVHELADGVISVIQAESINRTIERIQGKKKQLKPFTANRNTNKPLIKVIRFLFTRNRPLRPIKDRSSMIGYKFPILSLGYQIESPKQEISTLQEAMEKDFFSANFEDRLHLCSQCRSGFLNYKELDPKSGSPNLITENLIHHFVCAYVGPEGDFMQGESMVCPKCSKTLRHIGVDYDKPSVMYKCLDNDNYFQEPDLKADCMNCGHSNDLESLMQYDVFSYVLTEEGKEEAIQPKGTGQKSKDIVYPGFITYSTFSTFLKYEIERARQKKMNSSVGLIRIGISNTMEMALGNRYDKIIEEISSFVASNTDSSNILSRSVNSFFLIFPDTTTSKAKSKIEFLTASINQLLKNNLKDYDVEVISNLKAIQEGSEHQSILNDLRASMLKK